MKTFKQLISEVQEPLSQGEKNFKGLHNPINHKDLVPGVTDQDHVFNGTPQRKDPKTASYEDKASEQAYDQTLKIKNPDAKKKGTQSDLNIEEKTLTPAEMRKREEIVKSLKKKGMEKSKAYAIATATAKRVAEEALDEVSSKTVMNYSIKAAAEVGKGSDKESKRMAGMKMADEKMRKKEGKSSMAKMAAEEVEYIDEVSKDPDDHYAKLPQKQKDAVNNELRKGKSYWEAVRVVKKLHKEEHDLEEARRGRPRKDGSKPAGDEEGGREHIIVQLRKVVNLRGQKHVEFNDNSKQEVGVEHAKKALSMHDNLKRAEDKQNLANQLAKSHSAFKNALAGKMEAPKKKGVSLAGMKNEAVEKRSQDINPEQGAADSTTMRSDRGAMKTYTTIGRDGRVKLVKHLSHAKEVNIGESKDMTPKNMEKEIKHDCAKHVLHKEWGEGETVEGMHNIVETTEGEGYVTHYDVMFAHGIEQNIPVEDLEIKTMVEHWHKNYKPKTKMEGKEHTVPKSSKEKDLAALAEPKDKITHKDVLVGRGVIKKAVKEAVNMQKDSLVKLKKDPAAGDNIKTDLPPTQGNKPIGGEGDPSRVGGKYSMEEEKLMKLYDSLSEENKTMFESLIETEEGLEKLLAFAEEQGF